MTQAEGVQKSRAHTSERQGPNCQLPSHRVAEGCLRCLVAARRSSHNTLPPCCRPLVPTAPPRLHHVDICQVAIARTSGEHGGLEGGRVLEGVVALVVRPGGGYKGCKGVDLPGHLLRTCCPLPSPAVAGGLDACHIELCCAMWRVLTCTLWCDGQHVGVITYAYVRYGSMGHVGSSMTPLNLINPVPTLRLPTPCKRLQVQACTWW